MSLVDVYLLGLSLALLVGAGLIVWREVKVGVPMGALYLAKGMAYTASALGFMVCFAALLRAA